MSKTKRKFSTLRVYADFRERVADVAHANKMSIHDYLNAHIKPAVDKQYCAVLAKKLDEAKSGRAAE